MSNPIVDILRHVVRAAAGTDDVIQEVHRVEHEAHERASRIESEALRRDLSLAEHLHGVMVEIEDHRRAHGHRLQGWHDGHDGELPPPHVHHRLVPRF